MEYNTKRDHLIIPEYGRYVQKMISHATSLTDKKEQQKCVDAIIAFMGQMNPHLRDVKEFTHKLWDHLHIMSDFKLDVDSPFEKPEKEVLQAKPGPLEYPKLASKYRFYGNNIQTMIDTALTWDEGEARDALYYTIANHMKKCYLNWNKDTVEDQVIFTHLNELSNGKINLLNSGEKLSEVKNLLRKRKITSHKQKPKKKKY